MPEAAWFLRKAVQPFKAMVPHPLWGVAHSASVKVEGGANADKNRRRELMLVIAHPTLLFGSAEADPDDIGMRPVNNRADFSVLFGRQIAVWRAEGADDLMSGESMGEFTGKGVCDAGCAAVEEMAGTGRGGLLPKTGHPRWGGEPARQVEARVAAQAVQAHCLLDER